MSTLKADTIVASDGSSPVTLTKQSAAKAYIRADVSTIDQSLNISSLTDNGTGDHTHTLTNAMSAADFPVAANISNTFLSDVMHEETSSSTYRSRSFYVNHPGSNNPAIDTRNDAVAHGDLA